jgi:hypothetical protein
MLPPRRRGPREQEQADEARLLKSWKKYHAEEREAVETGPHGSVLAELFRMLDNLAFVSPAQVIGYARSVNWGDRQLRHSAGRAA